MFTSRDLRVWLDEASVWLEAEKARQESEARKPKARRKSKSTNGEKARKPRKSST